MNARTRPRPRKSLGQHWLTDRRALRRIADAADISPEDTVVEVGAGTGALTRFLAHKARRLIAVEVDPRLAEGLRETFAANPSVAVVEADITGISVEELLQQGGGGLPYVVAGNLPYFIGTAIVRKFLYAPTPPRWLIATLQQEVAESVASQPGRMTYLAVEAQLVAAARILFRIPPRAFQPPPKVWSAVVRLDLLDAPEFELDSRERFLEFVRAGFAAPRKHVRNSLAVGLRIEPGITDAFIAAAGADPKKRPAELSLTDWRDLYFAYRRAQPEAI